MRISDWSSAVCSSDLTRRARLIRTPAAAGGRRARGCAKLPASKPNEGDTAMAKGPNARDKLRAFTQTQIELTEGVSFEYGRASCRESGCQYVEIYVVDE